MLAVSQVLCEKQSIAIHSTQFMVLRRKGSSSICTPNLKPEIRKMFLVGKPWRNTAQHALMWKIGRLTATRAKRQRHITHWGCSKPTAWMAMHYGRWRRRPWWPSCSMQARHGVGLSSLRKGLSYSWISELVIFWYPKFCFQISEMNVSVFWISKIITHQFLISKNSYYGYPK